jgi:NAD(P)H-flavin reductase
MHGATDPMRPHLYTVKRRRREMPGTYTLDLVPQAADTLQACAAGQFNMLYVFGIGEVPISFSGDPAQGNRLVHTTRAVGAVTNALCALKPGATVGVRGPFGSEWPLAACAGKDIVLVAGGIGLAPLRPVVYHLLAHSEAYGNITVLYGARSPEERLYRRELERWQDRNDITVASTVDRATESWRGNVGVVTTLIATAPFDPGNTLAMVCGPEVMMRFTIMALLNRGVEAAHVYVSLERNMRCAIGVCGHCQFGPAFLCKDGPVLPYLGILPWFGTREM